MRHDEKTGLKLLQEIKKNHKTYGIFLCFWLYIPKTFKRSEQIVHIALQRNQTGVSATLIPINHFPPMGTWVRIQDDIILPHAMIEFIKKKLRSFGIAEIKGAISERDVNCGTPLNKQVH